MICDRNAYRKASERKMEWDCLVWRIHAKKNAGSLQSLMSEDRCEYWTPKQLSFK